jgi:Ser-tRNA(Ala) deacylase AlaX
MSLQMIEAAVETCDHLLWESISRVYGLAFSKAFNAKAGKVRVTYETRLDPRDNLGKIKEELNSLIAKKLPVVTLGFARLTMRQIEKFCSRIEYLDLFCTANRITSPQEIIFRELDFDNDYYYLCNFVIIGKNPPDYISCPCNGPHLSNTVRLNEFKIEILTPERVGKDKYEFRFEIDLKS